MRLTLLQENIKDSIGYFIRFCKDGNCFTYRYDDICSLFNDDSINHAFTFRFKLSEDQVPDLSGCICTFELAKYAHEGGLFQIIRTLHCVTYILGRLLGTATIKKDSTSHGSTFVIDNTLVRYEYKFGDKYTGKVSEYISASNCK